jgi:hypothetical protein
MRDNSGIGAPCLSMTPTRILPPYAALAKARLLLTQMLQLPSIQLMARLSLMVFIIVGNRQITPKLLP